MVENSRVLKWIVERLEGTATAVEDPHRLGPTIDSIDTSGLEVSGEALEAALAVDVREWASEVGQIQQWFEQFGDELPLQLWVRLDALRSRLGMI